VVVVAIPLKRVEDLPSGLFSGAPADMIVIDTETTIRNSAMAASTASKRV